MPRLRTTFYSFKNKFLIQYAGWYDEIGESTLADAILDHIIHDFYSIIIDGDTSMRERHGIKD